MTSTPVARHAQAVRQFNRFYTTQIGLLDRGYLHSPFSVTEARVIYELAQRGTATATELGTELGIDAGYLSRMIRSFGKHGLISKTASPHDGRQSILQLTDQGKAAFDGLNTRSQTDIEQMLGKLAVDDQARVIAAMRTIERLLGGQRQGRAAYLLRSHQPGDMGWVVQRHGALYAQEYGWNEQFEALVASIVAEFIQQFDPQRERCWMAELDGETVGSVFVVKHTDGVAKLRLLLVEPGARGLGIGRRLVDECIRFTRQVGYTKLTLWTNSVLVAARAIYERAGFRLVASEPHHSFGHDLIGETWELDL